MTLPLLIGIVGHRQLHEEYVPAVEAELSKALEDLQRKAPGTPLKIATSLAEGADRLAARVSLAKGLGIIAPLPFDFERFESDFPQTKGEFREIVSQAEHSFVAVESGCSGYEGASRWIARHCQIVIALWDGEMSVAKPGGTADTVRIRRQVEGASHQLSSVADYLGPVLHLHCPRNKGQPRQAPRWLWPDDEHSDPAHLYRLLSPLDEFNKEAATIRPATLIESMNQLPEVLSSHADLRLAFGAADALANRRQAQFRWALKASVVLAVLGYLVQQALPTLHGRVAAGLLLTLALAVVLLSHKARHLQKYLEYRALAEVLRVAGYWRLAGVSATPTDRFLNQHWGALRWVRCAVNAVWIPCGGMVADFALVKERWIDDQQAYYRLSYGKIERLARALRWVGRACFASSVLLAWLAVLLPASSAHVTMLSGALLLLVGALSHYVRTMGLEENAARYRSMAAPFSWCQKIWRSSDEGARATLVQELGAECVAEVSNWLLTHRNRPIDLIRS